MEKLLQMPANSHHPVCLQALQKASQVIAEIRETHLW